MHRFWSLKRTSNCSNDLYLSHPAQQGVLVILLEHVLPRQSLEIGDGLFQGVGVDVEVSGPLSGVGDLEAVVDRLQDGVLGVAGLVLVSNTIKTSIE